ncbi:unannotated protein [freshwater metagenome]|uniref:Unannotated protein n=1 Tax=freshwater metagenome TaxID=449393 RepID=A0A6J7DIH3_9ZZZZ
MADQPWGIAPAAPGRITPPTARYCPKMQSMRTRLLVLAFGIALSAGVLGAPASAATFATPQPPSAVTSSLVQGGVQVTWAPSPDANPPITNYVVHAGPDSCPITVAANATSAVMPIIKGPLSITPVVQAVNAYGYSTNAAGNAVTVPNKATPGFRNVQFLEFSDFHGAIESSTSNIGAAALTTAFAADRKTVKSTFTMSVGDNIGGAPVISSAFGELPTIEALNLMRLDVSTFGNHEHDRPIAHLRQSIDASRFDWVATNYSTLVPLKGKANAPTEFVIEDRGGVKVGFVGINTPDVAQLVFASNLSYGAGLSRDIIVSPDLARVRQRVVDARAAGAQLVVALVHEGWDANVNGAATGNLIDLAGTLTGADAVFGGHSHQQYASLIGSRPVVQVSNSGQMYSRTVICLDTNSGKPIGSSVEFVTKAQLAGTADDPATAALVAKYRAALGAKLDAVVGTVSDVFPRGGTPAVERSGETPFGDLAADAVRSKYGTDFVILNGGGIRDLLPGSGYRPQNPALRRPQPGSSGPYDVTLGDVISVLPFGNTAATTTLTGATLWQALENGVSGWPTAGRFPQISGFRFAFDPTLPVGARVTSVTRTDGTPIARDNTVYTVTTIDYMVYGGDGYSGVFSPATAVMRDPYIEAIIDVLGRDLANGTVTAVPVADGRITSPGRT